MNKLTTCVNDQGGSATLVALLVLTLLAIMGMSGARTASVETEIAGNDNLNKLAFYSAEASRAYVMTHPQLYGVSNIDDGTPHLFPNDSAPYLPNTAGPVVPKPLGSNQSYEGSVQYTGHGLPPRGSGYDTSSFRAHKYEMACEGKGPRDIKKTINAGFYRIGL